MISRRQCVALLVLAGLSVSLMAADAGGPAVGQTAPNIIGRTLDDRFWRLKSETGKVKVVNFFWVGCKPCREEMPELAVMEKQYKGIQFISVHTQEETTENVVRFVSSLKGAPSKIVQTSGGVQELYKVKGLPHTVVLDADNKVLLNLSGYTPANMKRLQDALQKFK